MANLTPDQNAQLLLVLGLSLISALIVGGLVFLSRRGTQPEGSVQQLVQAGRGWSHEVLKPFRPLTQEEKPSRWNRETWLGELNHQVDDAPHIWFEGPTGSGKTTLAKSLLLGRSVPIVVVAMKKRDEDLWQGLLFVHRYEDREQLLEQLNDEIGHRLEEGDTSGLTVVLDDFPGLASDHELARSLAWKIIRFGRDNNIRLVLLSQEDGVTGNRMEGLKKLQKSCTFVRVEKGSHRAVCEWAYDEVFELDTRGIEGDRLRPFDPRQRWEPHFPFREGLEAPLSHKESVGRKEESEEESGDRREAIKVLRDAGWKYEQIQSVLKVSSRTISEVVRERKENDGDRARNPS